MKNKALKKRLGLQVLLNLEEVFNNESPLAAKGMRKSLKSISKTLVKEFVRRMRAVDEKTKRQKSRIDSQQKAVSKNSRSSVKPAKKKVSKSAMPKK